MKLWRRVLALGLCAASCLTLLGGCAGEGAGKGKDPLAITIWHYYNSDQQQIFDQLVQEYNESVGAEQGVVVVAHSYGGVNELNEKVLDAVHGRVGAEEVPDVFASYADTAYEISSMGRVADISQYLTAEEQARYVTSYLDEGRFEEGAGFQIFPIAKATELLFLNETAWEEFCAATGTGEDALTTWEGVTAVSEAYYDWTDGQTPDVPDDGRAFFGRDAFANYIIIGSMQLGVELFQVKDGRVTLNVDEAVMRRLWDNYYVPYVNGWFTAKGRFRSDDIRTGDLVACVGSSSGASFFTSEVTQDDGSTYPIVGGVRALPNFAGTDPMAVQQGAGMVVTKSTAEREKAAVDFLKWFTQPEQNVRFAMASGYLPVTYEGNDTERIALTAEENGQAMSKVLKESVDIGVAMTGEYALYTSKAFEHGSAARAVAESSMKDKAAGDRSEVEALMASGLSRGEAVARYDTEENFQAWLQAFRQALESAVAE